MRAAQDTFNRTDMQTFQKLYEENIDLIYRYVYSRIGNKEETEELTAQVFLKAINRIDLERSPQSMQKWLYQIASTTVADYWRSHYRLPASSLDELLETGWQGPVDGGSIMSGNEPEEQVRGILQALPERYREVLTCRFLLKLSVKDTALRMGISEANVKIVQYRALKRAATLEQVIPRTQRPAV